MERKKKKGVRMYGILRDKLSHVRVFIGLTRKN